MKSGRTAQENGAIASYDKFAERFIEAYERLKFEEVHSEILDLLPKAPARVLDVGAGSGRDAAALAKRGLIVTAVEPVARMRALAKALHSDSNIAWVEDRLPDLPSIVRSRKRYSLILLSAVWMHISPQDRDVAIATLSRLLQDRGLLVITLRLGQPDLARGIYKVSEEELLKLACINMLTLVRLGKETLDKLDRPNIRWKTFAFQKRCPFV